MSKAKRGEELFVIVDCSKGIFQLISGSFDHSISIPILQQKIKIHYLHFNSLGASSFSLLSSEKHQNTKKRDEINQNIDHKKNNIQNLLREIENVKADIEKLEVEKEKIEKKIKEDEENSTQIEISNRMIKDMIQSLPSILTVEKKYRIKLMNKYHVF